MSDKRAILNISERLLIDSSFVRHFFFENHCMKEWIL